MDYSRTNAIHGLIQTNVTIKYSGAKNLSISESESTCAMDYRMHMEVHLTRSKE